MRKARYFLTFGLILLTAGGVLIDTPFVGVGLGLGLLFLVGSINSFLGGLRNG
jgi:hypothetical protein